MADAATNEKPEAARNWGWQRRTHTSGAVEHEEWQPKGLCVGWIESQDLYLDPESAFAAVQRLAQAQGASLPITAQTLWKRLSEKGILASRDDARRRNIVRKVIAGNRRKVIHILADTLLSHKSGPFGPFDPHPRDSAAFRAEKMGRYLEDEEKAAHETGPQALENSGGGPNGPIGPELEHRSPAPAESFAETTLGDDDGDEEERLASRRSTGKRRLASTVARLSASKKSQSRWPAVGCCMPGATTAGTKRSSARSRRRDRKEQRHYDEEPARVGQLGRAESQGLSGPRPGARQIPPAAKL